MWIATLALCLDEDYELIDLMEQMKREAGVRENCFASLGWLLHAKGEYEKARSYVQQLLNEHSLLDEPAIRLCYSILGGVATAFKEYDESLIYCQHVLKLCQKCGEDAPLPVAYQDIGEAYYWKKDYDLALEYEQKALDLLPEEHLQRSYIYRVIARVYRATYHYDLSLSYHQKVLDIQKKHLHENHLDFAAAYNSIAAVYHNMRLYEKALGYLNKALSICKKSLP
ncbi:unnamed protein product, partial [Didymodactylos carnosus]